MSDNRKSLLDELSVPEPGFTRAEPPAVGPSVAPLRVKAIKAYRQQATMHQPLLPPPEEKAPGHTPDEEDILLEELLDSHRKAA